MYPFEASEIAKFLSIRLRLDLTYFIFTSTSFLIDRITYSLVCAVVTLHHESDVIRGGCAPTGVGYHPTPFPFLPFFLLERGKRLVEEVGRLRLRRDAHGAVLPPQPVVNAQKKSMHLLSPSARKTKGGKIWSWICRWN